MNIDIPVTLRSHTPLLKQFFEGMVFKLHVNSFKDEMAEKDVPILLEKLIGELTEFKEQVSQKTHEPNSLHELFDTSNFCYLLFQYLRSIGVPDEREEFINEFFQVDTSAGRVFAKTDKPGSRYRAGEEIKGTIRSGRVYIRAQHSVTGKMVSLQRCEIVWFKAKGSWPVYPIMHRDNDLSNDSISNLYMDVKESSKEYPFVFKRENEEQYGYQRRHRGLVIRVGYWATPDEAAVEGLKKWKEKVKCSNET